MLRRVLAINFGEPERMFKRRGGKKTAQRLWKAGIARRRGLTSGRDA
jgi:hypothetical protein